MILFTNKLFIAQNKSLETSGVHGNITPCHSMERCTPHR